MHVLYVCTPSHSLISLLTGGSCWDSHGTVDLVICVMKGCAVDGPEGAQEGLLAVEFLTLQCIGIGKDSEGSGQTIM